MKLLFFIFAALFVCINFSYSQTSMTIDASIGKIIESKEDPQSSLTDIHVILPETNFDKISIVINNHSFAFDCNNSKNCEILFASDINAGRVVFHFQNKKLIKIGSRPSSFNKDLLSGRDSIQFSTISNRAFTVVTPSKVIADLPKNLSLVFHSLLCEGVLKDSTGVNGLHNYTFLCMDSVIKRCACGIPIKNDFENMYLPPCFDPNGNAISVKNQVLYDMLQTDPLRKAFLFEIVKGKLKKDNCPELQNFQFAKIKSRMSPRVGDVMAISVIAHKDSSIIIDSNYVNYFLDSAVAAQNSFTAAGNKGKSTGGNGIETLAATNDKDSVAKINLQAAVTLHGDLLQFNNYYNNANFIQQKYYEELFCLQKNIASFFSLATVPKSGNALAGAIESTLVAYQLKQQYYRFACTLLNALAVQYDSAINHIGNYRIFTQLIQIPNADEITIGMRTSKNTASVYRHNFLIKGGMKIDVSTGVFITGINNAEWVNVSLRFPYRDSLSGTLKDTTGNLLQTNRKKLNYNTGFLVHVYSRTGGYVNFGGVAGVTFNNSEFMMLLGASAMFRMGNARLSLVGGLAFGKEKQLDANQQQYLYDSKRFPTDKVYINNLVADRLPRFFTETNISTYDKLKVSWFAGITYNFASINLGK